jgi:thiamine kinase-like enzyme
LPGFDKYLEDMREFKSNLEKLDIKNTFTHGDVSINNMLITKEYPYPILIDMEFPSMGDPIGDIATFCVDAEYREDDIVLMLEYYLDRKASLIEQYHLLGLCAVTAMMWYSWATYKSAVEKDNQMYLDFRDAYHQYVEEVYGSTLKVYSQIKDQLNF